MTHRIEIPNLDDLLQRYIDGESENQLAIEAGVNRWTFRHRLLEANIRPRTQSEAEILKWSRMSDKERAAQVRASHDAARGREVSFDELCKRAKMRQGNLDYNVSSDELVFGRWIIQKGYDVIHNFAVGPYNCDIGAGPVIVEIWGGNWHPKPIDPKRTKYILDQGFGVLFIDLNRQAFPLTIATLEYFFALLKETRANPTAPRQYWMVRGDGELIFKRFNSDEVSLIPPFTARRDPANGQYKRIPR